MINRITAVEKQHYPWFSGETSTNQNPQTEHFRLAPPTYLKELRMCLCPTSKYFFFCFKAKFVIMWFIWTVCFMVYRPLTKTKLEEYFRLLLKWAGSVVDQWRLLRVTARIGAQRHKTNKPQKNTRLEEQITRGNAFRQHALWTQTDMRGQYTRLFFSVNALRSRTGLANNTRVTDATHARFEF